MSLEQALKETTEALEIMTAAFQAAMKHLAGGGAPATAPASPPTKPPAAPATAAPTSPKPKKVATGPVTVIKPALKPGETLTVTTAKEVADAVIGLANNVSRDAAVAVLTQFGVKVISELKPAQYADVLAAVKAAQTVPAPAATDSLV